MDPKQVIVIGAGLAGLSACVTLLQRGVRPVLLEANPYAGGRTASWNEHGLKIETGLHRFLGFYKYLPQLLERAHIKPDHIIKWEDEVEIRLPDGPRATFGLSPLHKPLKTMWRMLGNNHFLKPKDKATVVKFFLAGLKDYISRPAYLDSLTVLDYAQKHGVTKKVIDRVLVPATEGIFFLPASMYSAYALFGLAAPYWKRFHQLRVGAFKGGMTEVMCEPLVQYIHSQGGTVIFGQKVNSINRRTDDFEVRTARRRFSSKTVVLATSLYPTQQILKTSFGGTHFKDILRLQTMPSVTFQIELKKPSMPLDRTTFGPLTCMAAFAEQSRTTFPNSKGRLSIILSPPQAYIHLSEDSILQKVLHDAARLGVELKDNVLAYRKVVIPHDFYLLSPGAEALRPPQQTAIPGLFLAGDYTKQKYLATMEGAVYSGMRAAQLADAYIEQLT